MYPLLPVARAFRDTGHEVALATAPSWKERVRRCRAVVSHAGSGSTLGALADGLPMLLVPQGADQFDNAAACEAAGAAIVIAGPSVEAGAVAGGRRAARRALLRRGGTADRGRARADGEPGGSRRSSCAPERLHVMERADRLATERLVLEPLRTAHAAEMVALLDDPELHRYVGGSPLRLHELERRYEHQVRGSSADGTARWFNWIVRDRTSGEAVGYVQATVEVASAVADVAWVIGSRFQRRGYAHEAAAAMTAWLRGQGVTALTAHIHPQNEASRAVARSIGLAPTATSVDGEVRWENEVEAASGDDLRRDPVQPRRRPSA